MTTKHSDNKEKHWPESGHVCELSISADGCGKCLRLLLSDEKIEFLLSEIWGLGASGPLGAFYRPGIKKAIEENHCGIGK